MRTLRRLTLLPVLGMLAAPALGDGPDLAELIAKVDQTTKAVKAVSYKARWWVEGDVPVEQPRVEAVVKSKEGRGEWPLLLIEGVVTLTGSELSQPISLIMNETQCATFDRKNRVCKIGGVPEALELVSGPFGAVTMHEFLADTPFSDELNADSRKYEGRQTVGGTECHVVHVAYKGGSAEARWYFGVDDFLPHRVDRISVGSGGKVFQALELSELDTSPKLADTDFAIRVPEGYERIQYGLLPAGNAAPDWTLKTPKGQTVTLSKLRGKIVVLDFWATWCGPCKAVMPKVQQLQERYRDKAVAIYGIHVVWNRTGDPVAFMQKNKYTYGLLLNGDAVAEDYGVRGIPALFVIGPKGKILLAQSGFNPAAEKTVAKCIDEALAKME